MRRDSRRSLRRRVRIPVRGPAPHARRRRRGRRRPRRRRAGRRARLPLRAEHLPGRARRHRPSSRLTTDGQPNGPLYSWVSATRRRVAPGGGQRHVRLRPRRQGRRITGKLPRSGIAVIAEIVPDGTQVATVELLPESPRRRSAARPAAPACPASCRTCSSMNADGSGREATARAVIDTGWPGRGSCGPTRSDDLPFPDGLCLLVSNIDFECERDVARDPDHDLLQPGLLARRHARRGRPGARHRRSARGRSSIYDAATATPVRQLVGGENTAADVVARRQADRVRARRRHLRGAGDRRAARAPAS